MNRGFIPASISALAALLLTHTPATAQTPPPPAPPASQPAASQSSTTQAAVDAVQQQLMQVRQLMKDNQFPEALALMDQLEPQLPQPSFIVASNRFRALIKTKQYDLAYRYMGKIENLPDVTGNLLNELALIITDTKDVDERDLIAAKRLARHAMAITNNWPGFINTLARGYYENGEYEQAVAAQKRALDTAPDRWKTAFSRTLAKYQARLDEMTKAAEAGK